MYVQRCSGKGDGNREWRADQCISHFLWNAFPCDQFKIKWCGTKLQQHDGKAGATDATDMTRSSSEIKSAIVGAGLQCGQWGERIMVNNMDAIGFANSAVQSQAARAQLCDEEGFGVMGLGSAAYFENGDDVFYTYLVIDFVDYVRVAF